MTGGLDEVVATALAEDLGDGGDATALTHSVTALDNGLDLDGG